MNPCPKCQNTTSLLVGALVYPSDKTRHAYHYNVCWGCEIAQCTERRWEKIEGQDADGSDEQRITPWISHTPYHRQTRICGEVLDYWPTKKKFRFRGKTHKGDVEKFIKQTLENVRP